VANAAQIAIRPPELDEPARRLLWIIPLSIVLWAALLSVFSLILTRTAVQQEEPTPIEAQLIDIPKAVGGLQGNGGAPHPAAPAIPKPKPIVKPHPAVHVKKVAPLPPVIRSPYGTEKTTEAPSVEEKPGTGAGTATDSGESGGSGSGTGEGGGGGIGSDTVGARAIYAPTPVIPDELREEAIQTEAVARFNVSFDGISEVTLEKPTSSPRLNEVLLETLKQWKFFPAIKNGIAIPSSFEVRIPISVQ
jgi:protein TonB